MLKRVVSLIVGICCLLTMTGAFAAMTYTGTTTEYVEGDNSKIQVTSYVTGAAGDVATYLVYGNTAGEDTLADDGSNIVYVDQYKFASAGTWEISYQTAATNVGADIKLASTIGDDGDAETELPAAAVPVNITVTDGTATYATLTTVPTGAFGWYTIPYSSTAGIVSAVSVDGVALTDGQWVTGVDALYIASTVTLENDSVITITLDGAAVTASTTSMANIAVATADFDDNDENAYESIVMVGKVTGDVEEFGMILAGSEEEARTFIDSLIAEWTAGDQVKIEDVNAQKLPALGKNGAGEFGIRIYDTDGFNGTYYAVTYCYDGNSLTVADYGSYLDLTDETLPTDMALAADDEVIVVEDAAIEG